MQKILMIMTTLYLVRHGETVDNANQIMQGQTQGQLNENGIKQAQQFSDEWKDKPIDVVIASDLKRSIDTARIIAGPHHLEVITTPLLRERDWGSFTGRFIPDLKGEVWPDDIETLENLLSRAGEFIAYVRQTFPGKKVLAVGHGIINKAIQSVYYQKSMNEIHSWKEGAGRWPWHHQQSYTISLLSKTNERDSEDVECRSSYTRTLVYLRPPMRLPPE